MWRKVTFCRFSRVGLLPQFWLAASLAGCTHIQTTTHTTTRPTTLKVPREPKGSVSSFLHDSDSDSDSDADRKSKSQEKKKKKPKKKPKKKKPKKSRK